VNLRDDAEQEHLILGLHEALSSCAGGEDIVVLARTSVLQYQNTDMPPRQIREELDAAALVESSLLVLGNSLRVQARLVDGHTEDDLWSGSYDGELTDVLALYRNLSVHNFRTAPGRCRWCLPGVR
jgi:TolB-like protein